MRAKVAIIMSTYNGAEFLENTVKSVLNQSYQNFILFIVDDFSTDLISKEILKKIKYTDSRIKVFFRKKNYGTYSARNFGIKKAKKLKYLCFLDHDDLWDKKKLEFQLRAHLMHPKLALSTTNYQIFTKKGNAMIKKKRVIFPEFITFSDIRKYNLIILSSTMVNMALVKNIEFRKSNISDYYMWFDLIKKHGPAKNIQKILTYYYVGQNTKSSNKMNMILRYLKFQFDINKFNLIAIVINFFFYINANIKKRF